MSAKDIKDLLEELPEEDREHLAFFAQGMLMAQQSDTRRA